MHTLPTILTLIAASWLAAASAQAGPIDTDPAPPPAVDKSQYTLFNPTPDSLLRDLSPDRPDATESPLTVDAGRYAVEVSFFDWRRDGRDEAFTTMATNFKVGLTHDIDFQTVFDLHTWDRPAAGPDADGFSDIQFRLKWNLWGNDGGDTALALFPFVKVPTGSSLSNDEWEGGLIVPFSADIADGVGLGLMAEFDAVYDDTTLDHEFEFLHSAVLGFDLTEQLGLFTEYIGITGETPYQAYFAGGFTCTVNEDLILDCGTQVGLNDEAEDLGLFFGMTKRF